MKYLQLINFIIIVVLSYPFYCINMVLERITKNYIISNTGKIKELHEEIIDVCKKILDK